MVDNKHMQVLTEDIRLAPYFQQPFTMNRFLILRGFKARLNGDRYLYSLTLREPCRVFYDGYNKNSERILVPSPSFNLYGFILVDIIFD